MPTFVQLHEMPSPDPEPENYSIDDMMDRLRSRGEGGRDGEAQLVVRDDGTQVYRMRKRKRRSHQPKKEKEKRERRFRVAQVAAAFGLVAVSGLALLGSVVYLNSGAYRDSILSRIRTWTGAEAQITQFRVTPVSAAADLVELTWPESSMLESLKLSGVRADLRVSSMFGGAWKGSEMVAGNGGTLVLRKPAGTAAAAKLPRSGDCPFQFRYRSPKLSVVMGDPASPAVWLNGSEATLSVLDPAATTANLQFEGGDLKIAGWGDFGLKLASLQIEPSGMRLGTLRMSPAKEKQGEIEITNPDSLPLDFDGGETAMTMLVTRVPLSVLSGPSFGSWLSATVESADKGTNGSFLFKGGEVPSFSCRVPFQSAAASESGLSGLPLLPILAKEIGESWYRAPRFDLEFAGTVARDGGSAVVEDLKLEARGRLTVTGRVACDAAGALSGTLDIGLPEAAIADASIPLRRVFERRDDGYAWAKVAISGTGAKPADDLAQQLQDAATKVAPASSGPKATEDEFFDLTKPESR
jgi:hypothetical protein